MSGVADPGRNGGAEGQVGNQAESPVLRDEGEAEWEEKANRFKEPSGCSQTFRVPDPKTQILFFRGRVPVARTAIDM